MIDHRSYTVTNLHYQGMSKNVDESKDKTVKSVNNLKEASRKWTRTRKLKTKWPARH